MILDPGKTEFSAAEHNALRQEIERLKTFEGLSQAEISRQSDIAESVLSSYLKDKYAGKNDPVAVALNKWLKSRAAATELRRRLPVAPAFQPLATSLQIRQRIDYARAMGRVVVMAGVPGVSKTASARQYCSDTPRSWLATMDPATRGIPTMLLEVLAAMGITDVRGTPQQLSRRVVAKAVEAEGVILIDEAQHLSDQAIEQLRAINDKTRELGRPTGVILLGNEELFTKIGPTGSKAAFAQVSSRVAVRRYIQTPAREDVAALAYAWAAANREEITSRDIDFLVGVAMRPGGLRNVEMTFEGALIAAFGANEPLSIEHLQGAFGAITDLRAA